MDLPVRFKKFEELSKEEQEARFHKYHFENLLGKDLKPLLREKFSPILRQNGFKRVSDSQSVRVVGSHYVHCVQIRFSSKFPGRFCLRGGVALNFLPMSDWSGFKLERLNIDTDCLFTCDVAFPNGNPEFDNGTNLDEAEETIRLLVCRFTDFDRDYFGKFTQFPAPLDGLGVEFVDRLMTLDQSNSKSEYGYYGATIPFCILRLAMVHELLGNMQLSRQLLEYGMAKFQLYALKDRYEQLLERVTSAHNI